MRFWCAFVGATLVTTTATANDLGPHVEVDPLPLASRGYGAQIGVRPAAFGGVRLAIASFALDVPDVVTRVGGNDGFHTRVRPSGALYALYYPRSRGGVALGMSIRVLRLAYTHDDHPNVVAKITQVSPELVAGYQWHPGSLGFYLQPWAGLGVVAWQIGEPVVGTQRYSALPVSPFFTVNVGWEWR